MRKISLFVGVVTVCSSVTFGAYVVPDWAGDEGTTSNLHDFATSDLVTGAAAELNPNGTSVATVSLGSGAAGGWQDPTTPWISTTRANSGAWNINDDGFIQIDIPVWDGTSAPYELELWIDTIAFVGLTTLPEVEVSPATPVLDFGTSVELEETAALGEWNHLVWTGTVTVASSSPVSIKLNGTSGTSNIDRIAVYSRAIPEPAVITLILGAGGSLLFLKRRFMVE